MWEFSQETTRRGLPSKHRKGIALASTLAHHHEIRIGDMAQTMVASASVRFRNLCAIMDG